MGNIYVEEDLVPEDKYWEANNQSTTILRWCLVSYCCFADPTIVYKPELDYNHNIPPHSKQPSSASDTNININTINALNSLKYDTQLQQQLPNLVFNGQPKPESTLKREQFEEVSQSDAKVKVEDVYTNACQIPLTVTSTEDDNDSGTESIVSEDSDKSSSNASKGDRKRPGRKKGQGNVL